MSRYVVTGGAGFIGSHLVEALVADGSAVTVLDDLSTGRRENLPAGVELVQGSVTDADLVRHVLGAADIAGCFHLAAVSSVERCTRDWPATHGVNSLGSVVVFDAARANGRRDAIPVVYASSAAIYGTGDASPVSEDQQGRPLSAYGADKLTMETNARVAASIHGVPMIGLRLFNIFGPRQDPASPYSGVISIFAGKLARGEAVTIFGDGAQTRDFIYVKDAVRAFRLAMRHVGAKAEVYNVCSGRGVTLLELVGTLAACAGRTADIRFGPPRAGDIRHSVGDPRRAAGVLGFRPSVDLQDGLSGTLEALARSR